MSTRNLFKITTNHMRDIREETLIYLKQKQNKLLQENFTILQEHAERS